MFCKNCGNKLDKDSKFCASCGEPTLNDVNNFIKNDPIKVEVTNVTTEKILHNIDKGTTKIATKGKPILVKLIKTLLIIALIGLTLIGLVLGFEEYQKNQEANQREINAQAKKEKIYRLAKNDGLSHKGGCILSFYDTHWLLARFNKDYNMWNNIKRSCKLSENDVRYYKKRLGEHTQIWWNKHRNNFDN